MRSTKKLILTATLAVALLAATASPASAAGPFPLEISGGTWVTAIGGFDLTPGSAGPAPCPGKPSTLALRTDTPNVGDYAVSGTDSGQFELPAGSGNWYWANLTVLIWTGTYVGSSPHTLTGTMVLRLEFSPVTPQCTKGTMVCRYTGQYGVASSTSTYSGTLPHAVTGDVLTIDANSTAGLLASPCSAPFNALGGTSTSFVDLQLTVL